jgi:hypothetical protein
MKQRIRFALLEGEIKSNVSMYVTATSRDGNNQGIVVPH